MREIKFRGKRLDNGRWVIGNLLTFGVHTSIVTEVAEISMQEYKVDPATVGQFTGWLDRNNKEIYEGDIVKCIFSYTEWSGYIAFIKGDFTLIDSNKDGQYLTLSVLSGVEIIGNIHDNPELIKHNN